MKLIYLEQTYLKKYIVIIIQILQSREKWKTLEDIKIFHNNGLEKSIL